MCNLRSVDALHTATYTGYAGGSNGHPSDFHLSERRYRSLDLGASMSHQRSLEGSSTARGASASSDAALHTTQLVEQLARSLISERSGRHGADVVPSEVQIHGAVRLCIRILTSHIGEPLMVEDEASVAQSIRTRLVKVRRHCQCTHTHQAVFFQIFDFEFLKAHQLQLRILLCTMPFTRLRPWQSTGGLSSKLARRDELEEVATALFSKTNKQKCMKNDVESTQPLRIRRTVHTARAAVVVVPCGT